MLTIIGVIALIFIGTYLFYQNKFWLGVAGVLSIPFLFVAFLIDAYGTEFE
jgi:hypothetical protein